MEQYIPRPATSDELKQLKEHAISLLGPNPHTDEIEAEVGFVDRACIAVFDDYMSGGPGYCGKVLVAVWEASPCTIQSFVWRNGRICLSDEDIEENEDDEE